MNSFSLFAQESVANPLHSITKLSPTKSGK
nr:MAG TPA: hypothetical protein [Bacteriophage sp.]